MSRVRLRLLHRRQRDLHAHAAGARVDHAKRAQRQQREGLDRVAQARRIGLTVRSKRPNQPIHQRADQRVGVERPLLCAWTVSTKPGETTVTAMPSWARSTRNDSSR